MAIIWAPKEGQQGLECGSLYAAERSNILDNLSEGETFPGHLRAAPGQARTISRADRPGEAAISGCPSADLLNLCAFAQLSDLASDAMRGDPDVSDTVHCQDLKSPPTVLAARAYRFCCRETAIRADDRN